MHESTGQGACVYELSIVALMATHGWPPTVMVLSSGVSDSVCPETVSVSPALPLGGEVASSCGVWSSWTAKLQPPSTRHIAPLSATRLSATSITGAGGGSEGGEGGAGGRGGGRDGGFVGGDDGGGGGRVGGGEGATRNRQSSQSWPKAQPAYSAPGPPSSQTPSVVCVKGVRECEGM